MNKYFKDNSTMLFQGDSVTDCGRNRDKTATTDDIYGSGYPYIFKKLYDKAFPNNTVKFINRGVSGNRICDLLDRYDEDFKSECPDYISVLIGINDTWRAFDNGDYTSPEKFHKEYETLLKKLKSDFPNAKIIILEQFAILSNPLRSNWNDDLEPKRAVTRELAAKYADVFIPLYDMINEATSNQMTGEEFSQDGVHPETKGHEFIANALMKALGIF